MIRDNKMIHDYTEARQKTYLKKHSYYNKQTMVQELDNHNLSLRKMRLEQRFILKRHLVIPTNTKTNINISFNYSMIPNDIITIINSIKLTDQYDILSKCQFVIEKISISMTNLNTLYFLLHKLNDILLLLSIESLPLTGPIKLIETLHLLLQKYPKNNTILSSIISAFGRCSQSTDENYIDKFISVTYLQNYIKLVDYTITEKLTIMNSNIVIFFTNLISNNEYVQELFYTYHIFNYVLNNLVSEDQSNNDNIKASIGFFACFASVKKFPNPECVLQLQKIFSYFLQMKIGLIHDGYCQDKDEDIIWDCLWGLFYVYFYKDSNELIDEEYFDILLIDNLIDVCGIIPKGSLLVLRILGNISSSENDTICNRLYNQKVASFIIHCLQSKDPQSKKQTFWLMSNLAIGTELKCLFQYDLYENLLTVIKDESDQVVQYEFIDFLLNCLNSSQEDKSVKILQLFNEQLFNILSIMMLKENCNEMMVYLVTLIGLLSSLDKRIMINIKLENIGVKDFLEKCTQIPNEDIQTTSSGILDKYYN